MFPLQGQLHRLLAAPMRPGNIAWIGVRPVRRGEMRTIGQAELDPITGVAGDHYGNRTTRSRQVTLIAREGIAAIGAYLGIGDLAPERLRRNIVVSGINLHALKAQHVRLGSAILQITGECHPCSRMEEILGEGGYNAVRGHGGLTARIVQCGTAHVGDTVERVDHWPDTRGHAGQQRADAAGQES